MNNDHLKSLGRLLRESSSSTANFDSVVKDLRQALDTAPAVTLRLERVKYSEQHPKRGYFMPNIFTYSIERQKLTEEEAITVKAASDVWKDNSDKTKVYIENTVYDVRKLEGGAQYEVMSITDGKRKPFTKLSRAELDAAFTPTHPKQAADAEGYSQYRKTDELEAFKYDADTLKVDLGDGTNKLLSKGDYLLRRPEGDVFKYDVKKAKDFEVNFDAK